MAFSNQHNGKRQPCFRYTNLNPSNDTFGTGFGEARNVGLIAVCTVFGSSADHGIVFTTSSKLTDVERISPNA